MKNEELTRLMGDLEEEAVLTVAKKIVNEHPEDVLDGLEALRNGMDIVGEKFEDCEYFVGDLICAGNIMTKVTEIFSEALSRIEYNEPIVGKILICTVEGDLHDIGKNIIKAMLMTKGITVVDLGVNVSPYTLVEKIQEENVSIVALSGVMTYSVKAMADAIELIQEYGIRENVKVIIGGLCVTESNFPSTKADAWSNDAQECVEICMKWIK